MKKTLSLAVAFTALFAFAKTSTPEGWLDDYDAALKKAADENKHIVVDFSGSDWCGWCKRLDKEVFTTDAFKKAAAEKYVLLMVDSPMKKSLLTEKAAKENPKLVEKFGVKGFPTVVVLDPKGEEVCRLGYEKGGPEKYIEKLDAEIRDAPDVKKYIKPIDDDEGFGGRLDSWLKDWSENVKTNTAIKTCASFREAKLRPFLMAQMDPGGTATADERKILNASINHIFGDSGYKHFKDRKKLVEILDRTAKKPFATMVRAFCDNKSIAESMADWMIDGDFHGEDMRCVFWTLRNNGVFDSAGAKVLEKIEK